MKILVVGTGALACLFAARLASSKNEVVMLGSWHEGLEALRQNGVRLLELGGQSLWAPVEAMQSANLHVRLRWALVLVKSWQTSRAGNQLASCLSDDGLALTLQNGFGNFETLQSALGEARVALGVTTVGARLIEPGVVQHTGEGKVMIGSHPRLGELADRLAKAGFQVEITSDLETVLWGKLVINAAINPLTALLSVPNGELLSDPQAHALMAEAAREAAQVASCQGVRLPYSDPVAAVEEVAHNTAGNTSSMLQDVLRGAPTEIDAINGAIVRAGERLGLPTPVNRKLWQLLKRSGHQKGRISYDRSRIFG